VISVTPRPRFTPGERRVKGGWVSLRAGLDTEARGKFFASARDRTPVAQSVVMNNKLKIYLLIIFIV
jgi:hypothetical protein